MISRIAKLELRVLLRAVVLIGASGPGFGAPTAVQLTSAAPLPAHPGNSNPCLWEPRTAGPIARIEAHTITVEGKLYVFGGFYNSYLHVTARADVYDPANDSWTRLADMPVPVTHSTVAADGTDIWFVGGFVGDNPGPVVADVWKYDVLTDSWSDGVDLPAARGSGGLARLGRELHYYGGVSHDKDIALSEHWTFNLDTGTQWQAAPPLPEPRCHFGFTSLAERAYCVGGQDGHSSTPHDLDWVHAYDPLTQSWQQLAKLPFGRSHTEPGTFAHAGSVVIVGGRATPLGLATLSEVTSYDPVLDQWTEHAPLTTGLVAPIATVIADELIVTAGGTGPNQPLAGSLSRPWSATVGPAGRALRINAGGVSIETANGARWCSDQSSQGGGPHANDQIPDILGTEDDELYLTERTGTNSLPTVFQYHFPVSSGVYRVRLHFAEIYWGAPGGGPGGAGQRVFSVWIEGDKVLAQYDINAEVGPVTAVVKTFDVRVLDGSLDLIFAALVDRPKVSGIEVLRMPETMIARYCDALPNSTGQSASFHTRGSTSVMENNLVLMAGSCPTQELGLFLVANERAAQAAGSGLLCVGGQVLRLLPALSTGQSGLAELALDHDVPAHPALAIFSGSTWNFQFYYRDGGSYNFSNALGIRFGQ